MRERETEIQGSSVSNLINPNKSLDKVIKKDEHISMTSTPLIFLMCIPLV